MTVWLRRISVFAPELPGYGESSGEELLEDMQDFALHGWDVVTALGLSKPHLVGHSMGGMIAAEMACLAPERLVQAGFSSPRLDYGFQTNRFQISSPFCRTSLPSYLFHDKAAWARGC